jgi:hypothetical protein
MKRIPIEDYAFPALPSFGIGEKNTVSNGPDDGTNNCAAGHFWKVMRHGTTKQAIDNGLTAVMMSLSPESPGNLVVNNALNAGALNIGGHGNEGLIETGMGQTGPYDATKLVFLYNELTWGPEFDRIKSASVTVVSLWACHPGAGQDGADLLFAIAQHCGRAVRGGTGFLYCNAQKLWWENGSVWQVATPTTKPAPIPAPSPHSLVTRNVKFEAGGHELEATEAKKVEISLNSFGARDAGKSLRGQGAQDLVANLFRSDPMEMNVGIAAMITGTLRVTFSKSRTVEYVVYNDKLAVDRKTHTGYYVSSVRSLYDLLT